MPRSVAQFGGVLNRPLGQWPIRMKYMLLVPKQQPSVAATHTFEHRVGRLFRHR